MNKIRNIVLLSSAFFCAQIVAMNSAVPTNATCDTSQEVKDFQKWVSQVNKAEMVKKNPGAFYLILMESLNNANQAVADQASEQNGRLDRSIREEISFDKYGNLTGCWTFKK